MDEEFAMCQHCGETFFKEHLTKGKCKPCIEGHVMIYHENHYTEDE